MISETLRYVLCHTMLIVRRRNGTLSVFKSDMKRWYRGTHLNPNPKIQIPFEKYTSTYFRLIGRKQFNSITPVLRTYKPPPHTASQSPHSAPHAIESSSPPSQASQPVNSVCRPKSTPGSRVSAKKCTKS